MSKPIVVAVKLPSREESSVMLEAVDGMKDQAGALEAFIVHTGYPPVLRVRWAAALREISGALAIAEALLEGEVLSAGAASAVPA